MWCVARSSKQFQKCTTSGIHLKIRRYRVGGFEDFRGCKLNIGVLGKVSAGYQDVDENNTDWYV